MKTPHLKVTTPPVNKGSTMLATPILSLGALWLLVATSNLGFARDAVWLPTPVNLDWNTGANWSTSPFAPVSAGDTATFNTPTATTVTLSADASVASITFQPGASQFTIQTNTHILTIAGDVGFVNNSGTTQTIVNEGAVTSAKVNPGTDFDGASTAGQATIENMAASPSALSNPGTTSFNGTSTAANATITNDGATSSGASGGTTNFSGTTAGSAVIKNIGGSNGGFGGALNFMGGSSAGKATINNQAREDGNGASNPGTTLFEGTSTAGSATINNISGGKITNAVGGFTDFTVSSNAGSATITNNGGAASGTGGFTTFENNSNADSATIFNIGGTAGGQGGKTLFLNNSDGGTARVVMSGNATFDISGLTSTGMGIGSIEGGGNYFLGSKTLTVGGNDLSTTVSGVIQDGGQSRGTKGSLTKVGTGTLTLTGLNTYTGSTTITDGVLSISQDANLGATPGTPVAGKLIFNGGTLQATATFTLSPNRGISVNTGGTFDVTGANVLSYAGVISGAGNLQKVGSGTLTLTGPNTYSGTTTVNSGSLIVDGSLASPQTIVNSGAFLGGHGTIGGSVVNNGLNSLTVSGGSLIVDGSITSPQTIVNSGAFLGGHGTIGGNLVNDGIVGQNNSPGTLSVANNFTQNAGGTLRIGVAGTGPGQHDLLVVNGHAAVAGTMQVLTLGGFTFQPGDQITVLTAKNGVSGTFNNAQNGLVNTGTIVQVKVTTLADSVQLDATAGSVVTALGGGTTPTGRAVANALDSAQGDPRAASLFAFLNSQPLANLPHDLELIAPTQITSINATAVSVANVQIANVIMRLADVHAGSTGFSSAGLSINSGTVSFESLAGPSGSAGKSGPSVFAPTPDNRWGVFLTGLGEFTDVYSTPGAPGYNVNTGGFTFGVDYRLTPNLAIGLTGGYAHTNVNPDVGGNIDVNGGKLGAYATIFGNGFYLDAAATGGPAGYQTRRTALQGTASGNTGGADFNAMAAAGYDWTKGNLSIGPTASFQYSYVGLNSFTETGSLAPLAFPNQNTQSELSAFGAKATYTWKIGKVIVLPQISAAWQHEYGATAYSVIASFANGAGNSFTVSGPEIGRDSLLVGAGATVILSDRVSTYLYYDGEFARTNYLSNNVSGGVRVSF